MQGIQGLTRQPPQQGAQQGAPMAMQQAQRATQPPQQNRGQDPKAAISQQLIDALAVQRATSQKKQAAAGLQQEAQQAQMGAGGKPTVLQQLEQELVGLNKQEMVQRVMPTMQRKMAQEQQRAQQMPQQAMQQAQQAKQGLAQLQQQTMQQKQQAFRSGGIVQAFNTGGQVKKFAAGGPTDLSTLDERQKKRYYYLVSEGLSEAEALAEASGGMPIVGRGVEQILNKIPGRNQVVAASGNPVTPAEDPVTLGGEDPVLSEVAVDSMSSTTPYDERDIQDAQGLGKPKNMGTGDSKAGLAELGTSTERSVGGKDVVAPDIAAYQQSMGDLEDITSEEVNIDDVISDSKKASDSFGIDNTTPEDAEQAREKAYARYMQKMKYDETMDAKDKITQRRKERYEESQERSTLSILADFLIGFGGGTTLAAGFQGASANLERGMANAQKREDAALDAYDEANNDSLATQQELNEKATAAAEAVYMRTLDQRIAEQDMKSRIFNQTQQTARGDLDRQVKADIANLEAKQKTLTEGFRAEFKKYATDVEQKIRTKTPEEVAASLINMLGAVEGYEGAIREQVINSPEYMKQEGIKLDEDSDPTEVKDAREAQKQMLLDALQTDTMRMVNAIVDDLVKKSQIDIPQKDDGWGDAASDDAKPSYAQ